MRGRRAAVLVVSTIALIVVAWTGPAAAGPRPATDPVAPVTPAPTAAPTQESAATRAGQSFGKILLVLFAIGVLGCVLSALKSKPRRHGRSAQPREPKRQTSKPRPSAAKKSHARAPANTRRAPVSKALVGVDSGASPAVPEPPPVSAGMFGRRPGESAAEMVAAAAARAAEAEAERRSWTAGLEGERLVAAELAALDQGQWWTFHDLPIGSRGANVDHLVIGVGGVFCINTKNHGAADVWVAPRAIRVNGANANQYLPKSVREADRVGRQLVAAGAPVTVVPVLAFIAEKVTIKESPSDVVALHYSQLRAWLEGLPIAYSPEAAYQIVLTADRPETWAPRP